MGNTKQNTLKNLETSKVAMYATIITLGITTLWYFVNLLQYTINFPYHDDYMSILDFVNTCASDVSTGNKIAALFSQYNEHRILLTKLISWVYYLLFGELNFIHLTLIGNISIVLIIFLFYKDQLHKRLPVVYLIPLGFLIFNFRYSELTFWAMASIQNLWVVALAFLSIYFAFSERKHHLILSFGAGTLATFTSGNGMLVFFVITAMLILLKKTNKNIWLWFAGGCAVIALYFINYHKVNYAAGDTTFKTTTTITDFLNYTFVFLGGIIDDQNIARIIGITLSAVFIYLFIKKHYLSSPVLFSLASFLFITAFFVSFNRHGFGGSHALSSRYAFVSVIFTCSIFLLSVQYFNKARHFILIAGVASGLFVYLHTNKDILNKYKMAKSNFELEYKKVNQEYIFSNFDFGWFNKRTIDIPKRLLKEADNLGTFHFKFIEESSWINKMKIRQDLICAYEIESIEQPARNPFIFVSGWAMVRKFDSKQTYCILALKDEQGNVAKYFSCEKFNRNDINDRYAADNADYSYAGFRCIINGSYLKPGYNSISIILTDSRFYEKIVLDTPQRIFVK